MCTDARCAVSGLLTQLARRLSRERRARNSVFTLTTLALFACAAFPLPASPASLRCDPVSAYLGSFSTLDRLNSDLIRGRTLFEVQSDVDWQLELRLKEPLRRAADGLQLPSTRVPGLRHSTSGSLLDLGPHVVESGSGSKESRELERDWLELTTALEEYLDRGDPPGTYEGTLLARLLDASGAPVTDYISMTIQFDIARWVEIVDRRVPDFEVPVVDGALEGESPAAAVTLVSNSSWTLLVSGRWKSEQGSRGTGSDLGLLSACVPMNGRAGGWRLLVPGCVALGSESLALVAAEAPRPFTVSTEEIPIVIRFQSRQLVSAGAYGAAVSFTAKVGNPPP